MKKMKAIVRMMTGTMTRSMTLGKVEPVSPQAETSDMQWVNSADKATGFSLTDTVRIKIDNTTPSSRRIRRRSQATWLPVRQFSNRT